MKNEKKINLYYLLIRYEMSFSLLIVIKKALSAFFFLPTNSFQLYGLIKVDHFPDMIYRLPLGFMISADQELRDQAHQKGLES